MGAPASHGFICAAAFGTLLTAGSASAQTSAALPVAAADDSEAWFNVAREASAAGDIPKAIAALERVLLNDPNLPNIKLELGLLYLRVGQTDLARAYLDAAVKAPGAPENARIRARQALNEARAGGGGFGISGSFRLGAQYQSNPNGSPDVVSVLGPAGVPVLITGDQLDIPRGGDVSASASGFVEARYDLGGQRGNEIVASASAALTRYADLTVINSTYLGGQIGPRFYLGPAVAPDGFVQPYASVSHLVFGGADFFTATGGGITAFQRLSLAVGVSGSFNYSYRNYHNSRIRGTADEQTGDYYSGSLGVSWQAAPATRLSFVANGEHVDAKRGYWSRDTYGPAVGISQSFAVGRGLPWVGSLRASYQYSRYDTPDPLIDPARRRRDKRTEIGASLEVPLAAAFALELRVEQAWNDANIPNYDYNNSLAAIGVSYRF